MIDHRFNYDSFAQRGRNTDASEILSKALQEAIAAELLPEVRKLAGRVAAKLRELGHETREVEYELIQDGLGSVTFADTSEGDSRDRHRLRFSLDLVVSAGFPGYTNDPDPFDGA